MNSLCLLSYWCRHLQWAPDERHVTNKLAGQKYAEATLEKGIFLTCTKIMIIHLIINIIPCGNDNGIWLIRDITWWYWQSWLTGVRWEHQQFLHGNAPGRLCKFCKFVSYVGEVSSASGSTVSDANPDLPCQTSFRSQFSDGLVECVKSRWCATYPMRNSLKLIYLVTTGIFLLPTWLVWWIWFLTQSVASWERLSDSCIELHRTPVLRYPSSLSCFSTSI